MDTAIDDIEAHKEALDAKADEIIGMLLRLRMKLKGSDNLPLPEPDDLIQALTDYIREAEKCPR